MNEGVIVRAARKGPEEMLRNCLNQRNTLYILEGHLPTGIFVFVMIILEILKSENLYNSEHVCIWQFIFYSQRIVISVVIKLGKILN